MSNPCQKEACAIQDCLLSHQYDDAKCAKVIDQLYICCSKFYKDNGNDSRSPCCPLPSLLELKMKQRKLTPRDS
ncbi:ALI_HP2_G0041450.mRNA.1.CDS.1 [Saccharomyces cerevisiae]|nr:ALI_HP2_G0041450.mRNA.1.CDS.1 [Saccharomyces cerevisiae]CAI6628693.1 ALI_HP2_G0041450.mRNA.1.CDS.1 [Saccharomyces cerevisiae]CAI6719104.1 ALI_HP1_G0043310.mRNA.1.CDS.1 [Saccharomyces cerevisiae]